MTSPTSNEIPSQNQSSIARLMQRVRDGLFRWADSGWAGPAAATWSFVQSSVLPAPSDAFLLPLGLAQPKRAPWIAVWTTIGAMLGSLAAYAIGALAFNTIGVPLLHFLGFQANALTQFDRAFAERGWIIIALGSLPILPTKLTAIAAGALGFPVSTFLLVTFAIRGVRFLIMGLMLRFAGKYIHRWLRRINSPFLPAIPESTEQQQG